MVFDLFGLIGDLATDLYYCGYDRDQLRKICKKEGVPYNLDADILAERVERAYTAKYLYN